MDMTNDEQQIRDLVTRWAEAVHGGDLDGVLADHAEDIVMFDVPPPHDGVRGLDAYREAWPGFFEWQAQGASFDVVSLEVTAGEDVAYAHALLRCGMPQDLADRPEARLRLTLGLRKEDERHDAAGERDVRAIHEQWSVRTAAKDLDGLMEHIADDVVSYEHEQPLEYVGKERVREACRRGLDASSGAVGFEVPELEVRVREDLAVAWGLNRLVAETPGGETVVSWSRGTRVFMRRDARWEMVHQHVSSPLDRSDTG
jgi:uncharacterized protein (TIGR02246 family)